MDSGNDPSAVGHKTRFSSEICHPTHSCLARSARQKSKDQEVLCSIPTGGNFLLSFILYNLGKTGTTVAKPSY